MTIKLYSTTSESDALDKQLTELVTLTGTLREQSSMLDPVITFSDIDNYVGSANYAYIEEFHRFYFITNVESIHNNLWRLTMHVDVLYTYRDEIRSNHAIIQRNQIEYDLKLNDGLFQTRQNTRIAQYPFSAGFDTLNYVLAIAGN